MTKLTLESENKIAETLLFALHIRAEDARLANSILHDEQAILLEEQIEFNYTKFKLNPFDQVAAILRVREFDRYAQDFLNKYARPVVVHIGCGLDTRYYRVDNGLLEWYDLDLPEVIAFRQRLIPATDRSHSIGCSIFDPAWIEAVPRQPGLKHLFMAEGVFPYFTKEQVKQIFLILAAKFPGSELVCDGMTPTMVWLHNLELIASRVKARLYWGLKNGREPETWGGGIRLLSEWYYFDQPEPRLRAYQLMRYLPLFAKGVGIYHYQLGTGEA